MRGRGIDTPRLHNFFLRLNSLPSPSSRLMLRLLVLTLLSKSVVMGKTKKYHEQCIVRESNPGRPRGRRAFYHWTNDALIILLKKKIDIGNKSIGDKPSWFDIDTKLNPFPNATFPRYNSWYNGITSHQDRVPPLIRWIPARYRILTATLRIPITNMTLHRGLVLINWFHVCSLWLTWPESREGRLKMGWNTKNSTEKLRGR